MIGFDKRQARSSAPTTGDGSISEVGEGSKTDTRRKRTVVKRQNAAGRKRDDMHEDVSNDDSSLDDYGVEEGGKERNVVLIAIVVVVIVVIFFLLVFFSLHGDSEDSELINASGTSASMTDDKDAVIYDEDGNAIYNENNSVIDEDAINPGAGGFSGSEGSSPPKEVYSSEDQMRDINGVDVSAVYNVAYTEYVYDYVNYQLRRGIIDDGMEIYWLDVDYKGRKYRTQIPFYYAKDLDKEGICRMYMEVLNLEGGGKIISYMEIAEEEQD